MTKLNNLVGIFAVLIVAISPIPFGSNRPFFWALWGLPVAGLAAAYFFTAARSFDGLRVPLDKIRLTSLLWACVAIWLIIQVIPFGRFIAPFTVNLAGGEVIATDTISTAPGATWLMLIRIVTYGVLFVLALQVGARESRGTKVLTAIFWVIVAHAGFALLQLTQLGDTILGFPKSSYFGVATGTFLNRNSFATFLAMGLNVGLALLPGILTAKRARNESIADKAFMGVLYLGGLFVLLIALLATESRMGLFAGLLGVFIMTLLMFKQHSWWKILIPAAIVMAIGVLVAVVWTFGQGVLERVLSLESSSEGRMEIYAQVWEQTLTRPLLGFGGGAFSLFFPSYFGPPLPLSYFIDKAHSTYLALFSELGVIVGALPIIAVAVTFARIFWSQLNSDRLNAARLAAIGTLITCAMHSVVDFSLEIQANAFLFTTVIALGLAATVRSSTAANGE